MQVEERAGLVTSGRAVGPTALRVARAAGAVSRTVPAACGPARRPSSSAVLPYPPCCVIVRDLRRAGVGLRGPGGRRGRREDTSVRRTVDLVRDGCRRRTEDGKPLWCLPVLLAWIPSSRARPAPTCRAPTRWPGWKRGNR
jgi:hypothetical protein